MIDLGLATAADITSPVGTTTADEEQRRRIEQLQRRRASRPAGGSTPRPDPLPASPSGTPVSPAPRSNGRRRRHPASGARIGVAGAGLATMLGLVALMGLSRVVTGADAPAPAATGPSQVIVVVHRDGSATPTDGVAAFTPSSNASTPAAPIVLTARPTVRAAAPSPSAPAARTNGSR